MTEWMEENSIPHPVPIEELHCTLIESLTQPADYQPHAETIIIPPRSLRVDMFQNAFVLAFHDPQLEMQFHRVIAQGGTSKYPSFAPHITVSYSVPRGYGYAMSYVKPPAFPLELGPEKTITDRADRLQASAIPQALLGRFQSWLTGNSIAFREQCRPIASLIPDGVEDDACPYIPQRVLTLPFFLPEDGLLLPSDLLRGVTLRQRYPDYKARAFLVELSPDELSSTIAEFFDATNQKTVNRF